MMGERQQTATSPGPLHVSDLNPKQKSFDGPLSHPHKLEPLQHDTVGVRAAKGKRKKTRRKKRGEEQEQRGRLEGSEGGSGKILEHSDPLLDASTLQQMQARLDPLYSASTDTQLNVNDQHSTTAAISSGSESIPIRDAAEDDRETVQRKKHKSRRVTTGAEPGRQEEEEPVEISRRRRRRRRSRRESGSGVSETTVQQAASDEQERVGVGEERAELDNSLTHPDSFQGLPVPQYYPPPEEIHDDTADGERMVEGASPLPSTHTHHHASMHPNIVFMERADGRGFVVRRKLSSVVPTDDTRCGGAGERLVSSELLALYSHKFVQRMSLTLHGLVAGLSLWDCVVSNVLGSLSGRHLTLLETYHTLSLPAHSLYLLLLSLALLSLVDRLDLAKLGKQCWQFTVCSLPGLAILTATALTLLALVVSLSIATIDDRISLYPDQPSLWPDIVTALNLTSTNSSSPPLTTHTSSQHIVYIPTDDDPTTSRLKLWLGLSVFRSICCILGWGLLVFVSDYDRMEEYLLTNGSNHEQSWSPSGSPSPATGNHNTTSAAQTTATTTTIASGNHNTTNHNPAQSTTVPTTLNNP